ncbi:MAG: hypothetical protein KDD22_07840, partial [Bdellovibrionales bacterium]|nr:hypothetical protein [Bdellovibrionales bacterium]
ARARDGRDIEDPGQRRCGFGFDGNLEDGGRFYIFLGEISPMDHTVSRSVDLPFVSYDQIQIKINPLFIELRSLYRVDRLRDYRLRIDIDEQGRLIKATGRVYYENKPEQTYENTCVFGDSSLMS